jgi:hypothetical protein
MFLFESLRVNVQSQFTSSGMAVSPGCTFTLMYPSELLVAWLQAGTGSRCSGWVPGVKHLADGYSVGLEGGRLRDRRHRPNDNWDGVGRQVLAHPLG